MAKRKRLEITDLPAGINRRERRRLTKSMKKARRIAYCTKQSAEEKPLEKSRPEKSDPALVLSSPSKKIPSKHQKRKKQKQQFDQRALLEKEEKEISAYAKKLGLNKRRKKSTLPKSFAEAGLDYILEFCQNSKTLDETDEDTEPQSQGSGEKGDVEIDEDAESFSDRLSVEPNEASRKSEKRNAASLDTTDSPAPEPKQNKQKKRVRFSGVRENESVNEDTGGTEEGPVTQDDSDQVYEDIYGRLRDKKGTILRRNEDEMVKADVQPATTASGGLKEVDQKLLRTLKGSLNRLSESNTRQTAAQINQLLLTYSRNDVKVVLTESIFGVCLAPDIVPQRLHMEYCHLVALVHSSVAVELSAYFVERLAKEFRDCWNRVKSVIDKRVNNICQLFVFCYHLKVISSSLMLQLIGDILERFLEVDIELLLLILQGCGFLLRKDNPLEMKTIMATVHRKVNAPECAQMANDSRTKFMLDTLTAIKNNNNTKVTKYDPELVEHFRKILRGAVKSLEPALPMNLHDLYDAEKGRWWIVGSALTANLIESRHIDASNQAAAANPKWQTEFSSDLLELARKNRMNTDVRRTIFCVVMSAEDYLDAFEKLTKLDLRGQQEREIVYVCLSCCINEGSFNPYYGCLIRHFCQYHKRFQLTTQFALWDKFKLLNDFKPWQRRNLALLLSQLVVSKAISLSALKVFEFGELEPASIKMLRTFFTDLLTRCEKTEIEGIFQRVASKDQLKVLYDGILVFLQYYLLRGKATLTHEQRALLSERVAFIETFSFC